MTGHLREKSSCSSIGCGQNRGAASVAPAPRRFRPILETLEHRLAPATVVSLRQLTYQDIDGDNVTVTFSKPILTSDSAANTFLAFDTGNVNGSNTTPQQLWRIDLRGSIAAAAKGTHITVEAEVNGGNGVAHVGFIEATGKDLGKVTIDGDLGRIHAGDDNLKTPALKGLFVGSMGVLGLTTQTPGSDLHSDLNGSIGKIIAAGNIQGTLLDVSGNVGKVHVGGSIIGTAANDSGTFYVGKRIGRLTILGDLAGGSGNFSGQIAADGGIGDVTAHRVLGGDGNQSGVIRSGGKIRSLVLTGNLQGGAAERSGWIVASAGLGSLTVHQSILGGSGINSGRVESSLGSIGDVFIGAVLKSGSGAGSGSIAAHGNLGNVFVRSNVAGSAANRVVISAGGADTDGPARIGKLNFSSVSFADILCGYDTTFLAGNVRTNADARIGAVNIGGLWQASNLVAGVDVGADGLYGTADDGTTVTGSDHCISRIGPVTIFSSAGGTNGGADHFGIIAEKVSALSIDGQGVVLKPGALNDLNLTLGLTGDFVLSELKA